MPTEVILVDEQDNELGVAEKLVAHQQALCHRAFSIFVIRQAEDKTEVLLQRRHPDKYHCGGLWTNACCSHPAPGESTITAGERRLHEEMGFAVQLKEMGVFHYMAEFENGLTENEVDHVLLGEYNDEKIAPNMDEVAEWAWIELDTLYNNLACNSKQYTPWLRKALQFI